METNNVNEEVRKKFTFLETHAWKWKYSMPEPVVWKRRQLWKWNVSNSEFTPLKRTEKKLVNNLMTHCKDLQMQDKPQTNRERG